jgi:PAS domain S-box-containing protein
MAHVLIIDDESVSRDLLREVLSFHGHQVIAACDGLEGLSLARSEMPDLIITDLLMPELDGYALAARVRAEPALAHIRIMFYSALDLDSQVRQLAAAAGVVKILAKPAASATLLATIQEALAGAPPVLRAHPSELDHAYLRQLTSTLYQNVEALKVEVQARARAEMQLTSIIDSAMDAIITVGSDQRITIWNTAAERMFGCPAALARGQPLDRFIPEHFRAIHHDHIRRFGQTGATARAMGALQSLMALRADGTEFPIEASISQVMADGQQLFTVILRDISARKRAELELGAAWQAEQVARHLAETLQSASQALASSLAEDPILTTLLEYLEQLVPYDRACIMLLDGDGRLSVRAQRAGERPGGARRAGTGEPAAVALFWQLLARQESLLVPDTRQNPDWRDAAGEQPVLSWFGVPLRAGGELIGLYSVEKYAPGFFTPDHVRYAEALAAQAAMVLQNAHMYQAIRQGHARLQGLSQRLLTIQEAERQHIARELHDEIGQSLTGLRLNLELMGRLPPSDQAARQAEALAAIQELIARVRSLSLDLRPAMLDDLGLLPALLWHIRRYTEQTGIAVDCQHRGLDQRLPMAVETVAYRVVQEALTNVARHAGVVKVDVRLLATPEQLSLRIADAGRGFDPGAIMRSPRSSGLLGMQERVMLLGGNLTVAAAVGAGTEILADLPIHMQAEEANADDRTGG